MFTQKEVYDTYAEFEWATSSADEDLVFEYGGQKKEIPEGETSLKISGLNPGTDYTFTLRTQSGDARIDWQAETMLFWDDFRADRLAGGNHALLGRFRLFDSRRSDGFEVDLGRTGKLLQYRSLEFQYARRRQ